MNKIILLIFVAINIFSCKPSKNQASNPLGDESDENIDAIEVEDSVFTDADFRLVTTEVYVNSLSEEFTVEGDEQPLKNNTNESLGLTNESSSRRFPTFTLNPDLKIKKNRRLGSRPPGRSIKISQDGSLFIPPNRALPVGRGNKNLTAGREYNFVMLEDGSLRAEPISSKNSRHAILADGKAISAAGSLKVDRTGRITDLKIGSKDYIIPFSYRDHFLIHMSSQI